MNINIKIHGSGHPLVFFHGWGFDHRVWLELVPFLEMRYQLILVDLPGFGSTEPANWESFKEHLLLKLPPRFSVVGWSMGGLYAMRLASEESLRVQRFICIGSSPKFVAEATWPGIAQNVLINFHRNLAKDSTKTLNEFVALQLNSDSNERYAVSTTKTGLKQGLAILSEWDLRTQLDNITQPGCFMFGRLDPITPARTMNAMQSAYPHFKYILFKKSAHMPFLSHTQLFIHELNEFLQ